jgi:hypothetical protein
LSIVGLALEVSLKGFLREHGMDEGGQRKLGHDLEAFREAVAHGFKLGNPFQEKLAGEISPHYKDMSFRYQIGTSVNLPAMQDMIGVARSLVHDLYMQTRAKYPQKNGLGPGLQHRTELTTSNPRDLWRAIYIKGSRDAAGSSPAKAIPKSSDSARFRSPTRRMCPA